MHTEMERLIELLDREENMRCADCRKLGPMWCNLCLGVIICEECVRIHESITEINDRIVKIEDYNWTEREIDKLRGNEVNRELEKHVPSYFVLPSPGVERVYEEIYVRAKYVTKLFTSLRVQKLNSSTSGVKSGNLLYIHTLPLDGSVIWYPQYLSLDDREVNVYSSRTALEPIYTMRLADLVVKIEEEEGTITKGLAFIHFYKQGTCPHTYYFFTDPKETIDWYYAIQSAQSNLERKKTQTIRNNFAASTTLNRTGYVYKTGSRVGDKWRKRWFVVRDTTVCYFKNKDSKKPRGVFTLCGHTSVSKVDSGPLYYTQKSPTPHTFLVITPARIYRMCAENSLERDEWVNLFESILYLKCIA